MKLMCHVLIFLTSISFCSAQQEPLIGIQGSVGVPVYSLQWFATGYLFKYSQDYTIYPRYAVQAGVEYGPVYSLLGTNLSLMIDVAQGKGATKAFRSSNDSIRITGYFDRTPVLFWMKMRANTDISPYLQFGIGSANTRLANHVNVPSTVAFDFSEWQLCFGYGGGMSYQYNESLSMEIFGHGWFTVTDLVQDVSNSSRGYTGSVAVTMIGVKCIYWL